MRWLMAEAKSLPWIDACARSWPLRCTINCSRYHTPARHHTTSSRRNIASEPRAAFAEGPCQSERKDKSGSLLIRPFVNRAYRDKPDPDGVERSLRPAKDAEFGEDVANVRLDSLFANAQLVGDLFVGEASREQAQHVRLAVGEGVGRGRRLDLVHKAGGGLRRELHLPGSRRLDSPAQLVRLGVFQQIPDGPGAQRAVNAG